MNTQSRQDMVPKSFQLFSISLCGIWLAGCAGGQTPPIRVEPATLTQSYDYTRPVEAAGKSRPVYVLPNVSYGWTPAKVDDQNQWVGGHYIATVVEPGHWSTQEEAEISGRPFVHAGDGKPVVPVLDRDPGATGNGPAEIDVSQMAGQIADLQKKLPAAQDNAAIEQLLIAGVHGQTPNDHPIDAPTIDTNAPSLTTKRGLLTLKRKPVGMVESIPVFDGLEKATVRYLPDRRVSVEWRGKETIFEFSKERQEYELVR